MFEAGEEAGDVEQGEIGRLPGSRKDCYCHLELYEWRVEGAIE